MLTELHKFIQSVLSNIKVLKEHCILPHSWTSNLNNIAKFIIIELVCGSVVQKVLEVIVPFDDSSSILAHLHQMWLVHVTMHVSLLPKKSTTREHMLGDSIYAYDKVCLHLEKTSHLALKSMQSIALEQHSHHGELGCSGGQILPLDHLLKCLEEQNPFIW